MVLYTLKKNSSSRCSLTSNDKSVMSVFRPFFRGVTVIGQPHRYQNLGMLA